MNENALFDMTPAESGDILKIDMLLKEAELFQHDIHFLLINGGRTPLQVAVSRWIESGDHLHTGKLNLYIPKSMDDGPYRPHSKRFIKRISDYFANKKIDDMLVIGKTMVILMVEGETQVYRDKVFVDTCMRIIRSLVRTSVMDSLIAKQQGKP